MEELKQHEKVLVIMLRHYSFKPETNQYWRASDFQKEQYGLFVGYEATARMSELLKKYPFAFELRQNGRFREMRFRAEDSAALYNKLPHELARHLVREGLVK